MLIDIRKYRAAIISIIVLLVFSAIFLIYRIGSERPQAQQSDSKKIQGDYLSWNEVKGIFPIYAQARVIDVDSGLEFNVQRRGGNRHVDVQPVTAADTAIMKNIYAGQWTWKRKAVVVQLENGRKIAASMNGMPHGQGAISGNNFNGHFCIHFRNSTTHGSKKLDLAHQMMIWKSANILDAQLQSLSSREAVEVLLTAIGQNELGIAGKLIDSEGDIQPLLEKLQKINGLRVDKIQNADGNSFNVELRVVFYDSNREFRHNILINTIRKDNCWKIDPQTIMQWPQNTGQGTLQVTNSITWEDEDLEMDSP